jgi:DNA-binding NtrC family response regulator
MNDNDSAKKISSRLQAQPGQSLHILIVEDDFEVSRALAQMITHMGCSAYTCSHAEEALRFLTAHKVDLLLVDYRMPELTGLDLISILKEEGRSLPVVLMTGYDETEARAAAENLDHLVVLKKPIDLPVLSAAIERALRPLTQLAS